MGSCDVYLEHMLKANAQVKHPDSAVRALWIVVAGIVGEAAWMAAWVAGLTGFAVLAGDGRLSSVARVIGSVLALAWPVVGLVLGGLWFGKLWRDEDGLPR